VTATRTSTVVTTEPEPDIEFTFLVHLPRIRKHARYALRHVACADTRDDLACETLALAWRHFVALARRSKRPEEFVTTLALRCTQAVRAGRRLAGCERSRDVLSPIAKVRHGVVVVRLSDRVSAPWLDPAWAGAEVLAEALTIDPKARVPEQAAFRIDFPAWRARLSARDRAVADALAAGDRTGAVATRFGLSPARVSQLRDAFRASWLAFHAGVCDPHVRHRPKPRHRPHRP
jgi:DNA-directed RNA polymerase specialized sigma24 family protein